MQDFRLRIMCVTIAESAMMAKYEEESCGLRYKSGPYCVTCNFAVDCSKRKVRTDG